VGSPYVALSLSQPALRQPLRAGRLPRKVREENEKPPLFSDGYGSGAVRELGVSYTASVTVSNKLSYVQEYLL